MVREAKNIDFYTSGKQPTDQDFSRISEWIRKKKQSAARLIKKAAERNASPNVLLPIVVKKGK